MPNLHNRKLAAAVAGAAMLLTSACGGGGGGRPSTSDIQSALSKGSDNVFGQSFNSVSKDALNCVAKALHDSKLSDSALRAIVDNKKDYNPTGADKTAVVSVEKQMLKCVPELSD
ncbi:MAG TPA: hypothetical protein VF426_05855 [Marmoricola sp.]